jgi:hypothetical protein
MRPKILTPTCRCGNTITWAQWHATGTCAACLANQTTEKRGVAA